MQVYLVRHTRTALPPDICYGVSDVALDGNCQHELEIVIQKLKHLKSTIIYSSPLLRCRLLAEKISDQVILDDRLKELNFGVWELQPWDSIKGLEAARWMNDFVNTPCPGGESYIDLSERVRKFLFELTSLNLKTAIIVTHAGVIRALLSILRNIPLHQSFEIQIEYGEIVELYI